MSTTQIEWTKRPGTVGVTWNVTTGCSKVDRGCKNCYAEVMHGRLQAMGQRKYEHAFLGGARPWIQALVEPERWRKPRTVFVNSMSDLFHADVHFNFLIEVMDVIRKTSQHTYLLLTKRPERAVQFQQWMEACDLDWRWPPNVWLGTSVNDQDSADKRIPQLLDVDVKVRFVSYEPATGPVDFTEIGAANESWSIDALRGKGYADGNNYEHRRVHWVIMGGESGAKAQPMHPHWAIDACDQCKKAGTPFFFKQWGTWVPVEALYPDGVPQGVTHTAKYIYDELGRPQKMIRAKQKSFNLLLGRTHQAFPA